MIGIGMWRTNLPQPRRLGGILINFHQPFIVTVGGIFCFEFAARAAWDICSSFAG